MSTHAQAEHQSRSSWFEGAASRRAEFFAVYDIKPERNEALSSDMAPRRYTRLFFGSGRTKLLMETPPDGHAEAFPGHEIEAVIRIGRLLKENDFSTPEIYQAEPDKGILLIEDFGLENFANYLNNNNYTDSSKALLSLRQVPIEGLPVFEQSYIYKNARRFVDWFVPYVTGRQVTDMEINAYHQMWREVSSALPRIPDGFIHGDIHPGNIMLLNGREGVGRIGLLDYQAAMQGPSIYDLVTLLEDARREVPHDIKKEALAVYYADMTAEEQAANRAWYDALTLHFHMRMAGQFLRIALNFGKVDYLTYLPYLTRRLASSKMTAFQEFCHLCGVNWQLDLPDFRADDLRNLIREDAV